MHIGIGNIFRVFIGGVAEDLIEKGLMKEGLVCVEAHDGEIVDRIYDPYDNLSLSVILHTDGRREYKVIGAFAEVLKAKSENTRSWERIKDIFAAQSLQVVSLTVTEKAYVLKGPDGQFTQQVSKDIQNGPDYPKSLISKLTALLNHRFMSGGAPLALVSMDNCAHNGVLLQNEVAAIAHEWERQGFVSKVFLDYILNPARVSFPCTMIDKITPRPNERIAADLQALGLEEMQVVKTAKQTYIAPFVNAEGPQYLVIEDAFPNGRPDFEEGRGVYLTDRKTVELAEKMKVTACLNPVHTATGPLGVVLGYETFAGMLNTDPLMLQFARKIAYDEGMPMIESPGIISPQAFTDELFLERFPNEYLGDTNLRLSTDVSQGLGVRFGETIKAYISHFGTAAGLKAIPLGIAGWFRYLLGCGDRGEPYELAPDPMAKEIHQALSGIVIGQSDSFNDQLRPYLSDKNIFSIDLYEAGLGHQIEHMFREMISGFGAVREVIHRNLN